MSTRPASSSRVLSRFLSALMIGAALTCASVSLAPARAQTVAVESLSFGPKEMAVTIPRIEVDGSSLTQGELATLFQFKDVQSIAGMLQRFNAKSLRIPEIRINQNLPAANGKTAVAVTIYRDMALTDIVAGKVKSSIIAASTMTMDDPIIGKMTGTMGRMSVTDMDFATLVRFFIDKASPGETPRVVYGGGSMDGFMMKGDKFEATMGKIAFGQVRMRPFKEPLLDFLLFTQKLEQNKGAPPNPDDMKRIFDFLVDLLESFESDPITVDGIRIAAQDAKNQPVTVSLAKATMGAMGKLRYPTLTAENAEIKAPDGFFKIGSFTFKGIDFAPTAAGLKEAGNQPIDQWAAANWRKLLPNFDGFAVARLDIDVPDEKNPGQRIKAKLGDYDLSLSAYVQGIPTNISTRLRNFVFDIPANTKDNGLREILSLGYKALDVSASVAAKWNESAKIISFDNVSVQTAGVGAVNIKATVGNAISELFTGDPTMMQIAAMGLTAKDIEIKIDNSGVLEKVVAREAQKQGKRPEELRRDLGAMANIIIPGALGGGEAAQTVANAVSAFLAKPGSLLIAAKAKDPAGISIGEAAMASSNPLSLIPKLNISAKAN